MTHIISDSLRKLRKDKNADLKQLLESTHAEERTYYNWEEGKSIIPLEKLQLLASFI